MEENYTIILTQGSLTLVISGIELGKPINIGSALFEGNIKINNDDRIENFEFRKPWHLTIRKY